MRSTERTVSAIEIPQTNGYQMKQVQIAHVKNLFEKSEFAFERGHFGENALKIR